MTRIAVIGLGEAGSVYATAWVRAGHAVVGFDPAVSEGIEGIRFASSAAEACQSADAVFTLTGARFAPGIAAECLPVLDETAIYVDMTSSAPEAMREAAALREAPIFVDAAILGPVIAMGEKTPLIVSGARSARAAELFVSLGASVADAAGQPGDATARKLVRSVAGKGIAAVVCEAMEAARAAGIEDWMREQLAELLPGEGFAVIDRYESGTRKHAGRRGQEMHATTDFLTRLGVHADMSAAAARVHDRFAEKGAAS
ncbi:NAD(P)-dependent oxidoreductase [Leucobacter sp. wl10]|uniref:NAD(P)-dependent oxidoreductase n=1 Tax=Leucobacter sp. wl10 TaxID=2304677 RepID=UPI000E5AE8C5|nr:DUF1932 domain-containing protein [Leucobacter sp. wl10]RGE19621.1 NAD(P)-dependent oxidoreductase [Leucobacter sp. wl10]